MPQPDKIIGCHVRAFAIIRILLLVLLFISSASLMASAQPDGQVNIPLSDAEREWLAQHPRILVGIMDAWPPLNYLDNNNEPQGVGMEYLAAINKRLGNSLIPVPAPFKENYDRVLNRQLDAIMDISQRPDREALFNFTRPYIVIPHVLVGRKGDVYFKSEHDLAGKVVALERGFHNITYFKMNYPGVIIREYGSTSEALDAVSRGDADAYAGNRAVVVHLIEKELLNNLRLMGKLTEPKSTLQIGVQKEQVLLASILDKALASLTMDEERAIRQKWIQEGSAVLELSAAEQAWLKAHPTIRVALDPEWAPVEFLDKHGIPQGIASEYLQKIGNMLGIRFDVAKGHDWQSLVEGVKKHDLDMFSSLLRTEEREAYMGFTDSYLSLPIGIFTRQEAQYIVSMDELTGKKIAAVKGHAIEQILKSKYPGLKVVPATSIVTALQQLANGEVDAVADSTLSTGYYLGQMGITGIKLAGETPYRYEISMGVRSDWPELVHILNKALRNIPESEKGAIYTKWTSLRPDQKVDYSLVWKIVAGALAVVVILAFWTWSLGREIGIRKQTEVQLQASQTDLITIVEDLNLKKEELEAANHKLQDLDRLKSMFIASMSHELRTPLNSIIGFTGILLQGLPGPLNDEQRKQLGMVKASAQHLLELITDIIDLSKIEAGKIDININEFDLSGLVRDVVNSLQPAARKKGIGLVVVGPEVLSVKSDHRRVQQVLVNLVGNAVKFTDSGEVVVTATEDKGKIAVAVRDTGPGIHAEDMDKLFKYFSQVTSSNMIKHEGTGLGLYLSQKLMGLLGGNITVTSEFGKGSEFVMILTPGGDES